MPTVATTSQHLADAFRATPPQMLFCGQLEDVRGDVGLLGYLPHVERAWEELGLAGVLFSDGRPVLYLKESKRPLSTAERTALHRQFWNQGIASVLVLGDPSHVYIYSSLANPTRDSQADGEALVETLERSEYALHARQFLLSLATGTFYEQHQTKFDPQKTVDAYLLAQLEALKRRLCAGETGLPIGVAHALLGRILFVCYMLDRRIVRIEDVGGEDQSTGAMRLAGFLMRHRTFPERRDALYAWFAELKQQFNGTMFDHDLDMECRTLRAIHLNAITGFLRGDDVECDTHSLGFWAYDFGMIPVETISAIYESFLSDADPKGKRQSGAFYTPRFLAEMVLDVVADAVPDLPSKRCLDPACGSGIFLVALFSRMTTAWLNRQPRKPSYAVRVRELQRILREQIRGIDIHPEACRIACFSLYLAYLDRLDPSDIHEHAVKTGKALPKLLANASEVGESDGCLIPVVRCADALPEFPGLDGTFDVVVGNPPWTGRNGNLEQRFAERCPAFLRPRGTACLLLPTSLLLNQTDGFQLRWLRSVTLQRVVNLADYRFLLFQNAIRPALIALFQNEPPACSETSVRHDAPKFRRDTLREGCITIGPSDTSWVPLRDVLVAAERKQAPTLWKSHLWGTPRDRKLLSLLSDLPVLGDVAGEPSRGLRWIKGQGFQTNTTGKSTTPTEAWWSSPHAFLSARSVTWKCGGLVLPMQDLEPVGNRFRSLHRPRDRRLYEPPMVLVSQGFGKVAYCDAPVLFQHALQSIKGPSEDAELLMFLAAYLRSPLANYFLFHTSANWGAERDKVHFNELLRVPFPLPDSRFVAADARRIVSECADELRKLRLVLDGKATVAGSTDVHRDVFGEVALVTGEDRRLLTASVQQRLNERVYDYFGITEQERMLVEDTVQLFEPSSTPTKWRPSRPIETVESVNRTSLPAYSAGLAVYAETLASTLNEWSVEQGSRLRLAVSGGVDDATGMALVELTLSDREDRFHSVAISTPVWKVLQSFGKRKGRVLDGARDVVLYGDRTISIARPAILANWTRTAALNDADRIYAEVKELYGAHA